MNLSYRNLWRTLLNQGLLSLMVIFLCSSLAGCSKTDLPAAETSISVIPEPTQTVTEVSPPLSIQALHRTLEQYQPQVTLLSPQPDEVLQDKTVTVEFNVENFPIFQDETFGLGPHLKVILDDEPSQRVYDIDRPLIFDNLGAGTHTLRMFAAYPWDESFKNEQAYTQTTFHLFTKTPDNNPDVSQPLLTLNSPQGTYGAEPVLLDFYLSNLPLEVDEIDDDIDDGESWQVEITINGERYLIDQWQPIYIEGVQPGQNWVQVRYLNQQGEPVKNVYNDTAKVFTYDPDLSNSLAQLFKGELPETQLQAIVDPDYTPVVEEADPLDEVVDSVEEVIEEEVIEIDTPEEIEEEVIENPEELEVEEEVVEDPEELEVSEEEEEVEAVITIPEETEVIPDLSEEEDIDVSPEAAPEDALDDNSFS